MIEKTHGVGDKVTISDPTGSPMIKPFNGKTGILVSQYGKHKTIIGVEFWGYYVRMQTGEVLGVSRRLLSPAEPAHQNRGDLDKVVAWSDCPWRPDGNMPRPHQGT